MEQLRRKPYDSDLTDRQWELIVDLASLPGKSTGRHRVNQREAFNACLYVLSTGCRWNDLPHDFGVSDSSAYRYLLTLKRRKLLTKIFDRLKGKAEQQGKIRLNNCYLDASVVKSKRGAKDSAAIRANTGLQG